MRRLQLFVCLLFMLLPLLVEAKDVNVLKYGADATGKRLATSSINRAIEACHSSGGGRVIFPEGQYLSGTIFLKSGVEMVLERGSVILASPNMDDFPAMMATTYRSLKDLPNGFRALIYADQQENIAISGSGTIDGNGDGWVGFMKPGQVRPSDTNGRPRNLFFVSCKDIKVSGVFMTNCAIWNQHYLNCEDVMIDNIKVYNHSNYNNDAIDIDGCRRVVLSNSILDSSDDAITLKSTGEAPCEDIVVTNCVISSCCNGIKAGTESTGGFRNIAISNCVITPTKAPENLYGHNYNATTGISLELVDGGVMEGITISNIVIEDTQCPLYIRLNDRARKHIAEAPKPPYGKMRNISISNLVAYGSGNYSSSITASEGGYVENVTLSNIQLYNKGWKESVTPVDKMTGITLPIPPGDEPIYYASASVVPEMPKAYPTATKWKNLPSSVLFIRHVKDLMIDNIIVDSQNEDPRVPIVADDVKGLYIGASRVKSGLTSTLFFEGSRISDYRVDTPIGWQGEVVKIIE